MHKQPKINQEQLEQERVERLKRQLAHETDMITALVAGRLICHDHVRGTWSAEEYFIPSSQVWITKAEAQRKLEDNTDNLVIDGSPPTEVI
jgi:hypothetical protein